MWIHVRSLDQSLLFHGWHFQTLHFKTYCSFEDHNLLYLQLLTGGNGGGGGGEGAVLNMQFISKRAFSTLSHTKTRTRILQFPRKMDYDPFSDIAADSQRVTSGLIA